MTVLRRTKITKKKNIRPSKHEPWYSRAEQQSFLGITNE